jgi:hypothetical protein
VFWRLILMMTDLLAITVSQLIVLLSAVSVRGDESPAPYQQTESPHNNGRPSEVPMPRDFIHTDQEPQDR